MSFSTGVYFIWLDFHSVHGDKCFLPSQCRLSSKGFAECNQTTRWIHEPPKASLAEKDKELVDNYQSESGSYSSLQKKKKKKRYLESITNAPLEAEYYGSGLLRDT